MALRVAITRDEPTDGPLADALLRRGLVPLACPVLYEAPPRDSGPLEHSAMALDQYAWLVVASVRAVDAVLHARRGRPLPATLNTAAVGLRTAAALREAGARHVLTGAADGAAALLDALTSRGPWNGVRVLVPRAAAGLRILPEGLAALGAQVDEVEAYRTESPPAPALQARWTAVAADAVVFASPSAVRALVSAVGASAFTGVSIIAIGPTTAAAVNDAGLDAIVSPQADPESVAATAVAASSMRRNGS